MGSAMRSRSTGSSPLARGLRHLSGSALLPGRIIPARAGFTRPGRPVSGRPGDHPRSRGVYMSWPKIWPTAAGSSPLARGLRPGRRLHHDPARIIPARAGFTYDTKPDEIAAVDHPRSRGVYLLTRVAVTIAIGSSPLARGLPRSRPNSVARQRIIPARAGFTISFSAVSWPDGDHPRSRGVYP